MPRYLRRLVPVFLALATTAFAAKTYPLTGSVIALTDTTITLQTDDERWEIARTPATRVDGKLALGSRVTIHCKLSAETIEVKETKKRAGSSFDSSSTAKADEAAERAAEKARQKAEK